MTKCSQKNSCQSCNSCTSSFTYPAISVIIPMYNVEKYIGETLDSLSTQTFQDFEVIVVDDCSTDNSVAVVESYVKKFDGRLILAHMKKNTGGAGFPRNKGIELSRGKYIFFCDSDDTITPTAFEELYFFVKKFDADVVQCEKRYEVPNKFWYDTEYIKNLKPSAWPTGNKIFINEPTMLTEDFGQRVFEFTRRWLTWGIGTQIVRRNFIIEREIKFEHLPICEDMLFTICLICSAKRYVVVPNVIYFYRQREGSAMHSHLELSNLIHRVVSSFKDGLKYIDSFLSDNDFFLQRLDLKYAVFDMFMQEILGHLSQTYTQIPVCSFDNFLRNEFRGDNNALTSFIFNTMNIYRLQIIQAQQRIVALENELRNLKG